MPNPSNSKKRIYADDDYEPVGLLFRLRAPALGIGLLLGIGISFLTSRFEEVLAYNVHVAFFLPFVVYVAAAVGTQTEAIYARDLKTGRAKFINYFHKESALGLLFGIFFGTIAGGITYLWLNDSTLATCVFLATSMAVGIAPLIGILVTQLFQRLGEDPATGSGPIANVIQDMMSIVIYGSVCTWLLI